MHHEYSQMSSSSLLQTSITIDDVIYVIDVGKVKEIRYDPENALSKLVETWVTRAAAKQRRGRAGRTQPGTCYKLYTRIQEENMAKFPVPEILRVPLESISLTVKVMREEEEVKVSMCAIYLFLVTQLKYIVILGSSHISAPNFGYGKSMVYSRGARGCRPGW